MNIIVVGLFTNWGRVVFFGSEDSSTTAQWLCDIEILPLAKEHSQQVTEAVTIMTVEYGQLGYLSQVVLIEGAPCGMTKKLYQTRTHKHKHKDIDV